MALRLRPRLADWINRELDHIIDHLRHHLYHLLIRGAQERISIDFNEPESEVLIEQEIKAEQLKAILSLLRVHLMPNTKKSVDHNIAHPRHKMLFNR